MYPEIIFLMLYLQYVCVGYLYPDIRAKGLKSITSPHPTVKNATTASSDAEDEVSASSDPQGPGHASSNAEDEVSASSDPQGPGHASSGPAGRALPRPTLGSDSVSPGS